ncbi:MAG: transposase [Sphingobium sp.]
MSQVTIISGAERRRSWTAEQKLALVQEAFSPGACVADVARRADIRTNQLYRWRERLMAEARECEGFMPVVLAESTDGPPRDRFVMVVEVGSAVVRITSAASASLVTAVLRTLPR